MKSAEKEKLYKASPTKIKSYYTDVDHHVWTL